MPVATMWSPDGSSSFSRSPMAAQREVRRIPRRAPASHPPKVAVGSPGTVVDATRVAPSNGPGSASPCVAVVTKIFAVHGH